MPPWQSDKNWSGKFVPELKRICGEHLIGEAPQEEDAEHNTDLIVLRLEAVRIACRVRKHKYVAKYGGEFTIRCSRPKGVKTELAKIIEGWGDYLLYAFANEPESELASWVLGDLKVFRSWFANQLVRNSGALPGELCPNSDGSSQFRAFHLSDMPAGFIKARREHALSPRAAVK